MLNMFQEFTIYQCTVCMGELQKLLQNLIIITIIIVFYIPYFRYDFKI